MPDQVGTEDHLDGQDMDTEARMVPWIHQQGGLARG